MITAPIQGTIILALFSLWIIIPWLLAPIVSFIERRFSALYDPFAYWIIGAGWVVVLLWPLASGFLSLRMLQDRNTIDAQQRFFYTGALLAGFVPFLVSAGFILLAIFVWA